MWSADRHFISHNYDDYFLIRRFQTSSFVRYVLGIAMAYSVALSSLLVEIMLYAKSRIYFCGLFGCRSFHYSAVFVYYCASVCEKEGSRGRPWKEHEVAIQMVTMLPSLFILRCRDVARVQIHSLIKTTHWTISKRDVASSLRCWGSLLYSNPFLSGAMSRSGSPLCESPLHWYDIKGEDILLLSLVFFPMLFISVDSSLMIIY